MIKFLLFFLFPLVANAATNVAISTTNAEKFNYLCDSFQIDASGVYQFAFCRTPTPPPPPATGDVGFMKGTWRISDTHYVVDQSERNGAGNITKAPGCVNQQSAANNLVCSSTYQGFAWKPGNILSIRYRTASTLTTLKDSFGKDFGFYGYFQLYGQRGEGVPMKGAVSLSRNPGDFSNANCTKSFMPGSSPRLHIGPTFCPVEPNTLYYLNIRSDMECSAATCVFKIGEPMPMAQ